MIGPAYHCSKEINENSKKNQGYNYSATMFEINLQLYSILREKLPPEANGQAVLQLKEGTILADLLDDLKITRRVVISVNGAHETDMSRRLQHGDQVKIFSSISGG